MGMRLQPQCLQLDSVLQTVSVLEAVIRRSFGPDGGQVLFTRDTGQTLLTRHGTRILSALRVEHPLARMVVECVRRHSSVTGDGSKTFVLLLASLLREIQKHTRKAPWEGAGAKRLAEALLVFGLDELSDVITVGVAPHGSSLSDTHNPGQTDTHTLCRLLSAFLHTRISPTHAEIISQLTCELLSHWSCNGDFVNEHFPALHTAVSGFPIGCSRLLEGQVIHADFSTPLPLRDHGPIRALVVTEPLEPSLLIGGTVLELGGANRGIESVCVRSGRGLESVCVILQHLGVSLLLSSVRQSEAVLAAAGRYGVCVLECVCEDDLTFFSLLSGAQPVSDWAVIGQEHVATVTFCRPLVLGAHRYVNVGFPKPEDRGRPHSLVVCGLTEGQTEQSVCAVRDALHMLHTTWGTTHRTRATDRTVYTDTDTHTDTDPDVMEPCRVISVGGTFEFLLHHTLLQHTHANKDIHTPSHLDTPAVSGMLAEALLIVPRQIYSHSPRRYLEAHAHTLSCIRKHGNSPDPPETSAVLAADGSNMVQADTGSGSMSGSGSGSGVKEVSVGSSSGSSSGVESVSCKYQLILAVLQCLRSLLSVDTVLHTNTSHTCQREEEEDGD
ncbi:Bardet-Biedl syndrome 10 protein homolog [Coregonus clupeaformis]|uniref:Bardet-Biedl syndrome 10 protein homolog n=1 Tax=Coregonus clupeaformis TaxID=59861 RepID=UPI001BDF79A3|nr:Bardet-Biedl syndrome 10 protein homolog [Coregonus clupeaformis]XP_041709643.1 Bardet-Biedl syndrome 10 protein homolog [Coregonus clupeaformis]